MKTNSRPLPKSASNLVAPRGAPIQPLRPDRGIFCVYGATDQSPHLLKIA